MDQSQPMTIIPAPGLPPRVDNKKNRAREKFGQDPAGKYP